MKTVHRPIVDTTPVHAVAFNFDDMTQKAKAYLATVQRDAAKIVADAKTEAESIRKRAEQEGRKAAMAEMDRAAEQKVAAQVKTLLPALQETLKHVDNSRGAWLKHWEKQAVGLAAAIAKRIVRRELSSDPEITLSLVREALELAAGSTEIRIYLNPDDHRSLGRQASLLIEELKRAATAEVITSADVTPGGCRVETTFGVIDQQLEAQLARIEEELS